MSDPQDDGEVVIVQQPTTTEKLAPDDRDEHFEKINMSDAVTWNAEQVVEEILSPLGLRHYGAKFEDQNIAGRLLSAITEIELKDLGITKIGDKRQLLNALDSIKKGQEILDRNDVTQKFHTPPYAKRHLDLFGGSIPESKSSVQKRLSRMENDLEQHQNPKGSCCSKPDSTLTAEDRQGTIQSLGAKITKLSNTLKGIERMELELEKLKGMPTPSGAAEKEKHHQKIRELKERLGIGGHQEACCGLSATASVETCICLQFRPTVIGSKEFWEDGQGCAWAYHGDSKCDAVHNFCCACRVKHKRYDFTRTGMQITDVPSLCDEIWLKYFCCLCWDWYAVWGQNEDFDFRFLKEMDRTDEPTCWHWCHLRTLRLGFQNDTHDKIKLEKERIAREEAKICCGACLRSSLPCKRDYTPNILDNDGDDRQWVIIRHPALTKQWEGHFRYIWDNVRLVASSHA